MFFYQATVYRRDQRILTVTIRSEKKPHKSCSIVKGTHDAPLWMLNLYFRGILCYAIFGVFLCYFWVDIFVFSHFFDDIF